MRASLAAVSIAIVASTAGACGGGEFSGTPGTGGTAPDSGLDSSAGTGGTTQDGASGTGGEAGIDGSDDAGGSGGSGGADAAGGSGGSGPDAGGSGGGEPDAGGEAPCATGELPVTDAVFASPDGSDSNAGTAQFPVQTIGAALLKAKAAMASRIYLRTGDYTLAATLHFGAAEAGIIIEGGWSKNGPTWAPDCVANRRAFTTITVDAGVAVRVEDVTKVSGLRHLTIATKAEGSAQPGQPGESLFGVWVSGAQSVFNLYDVDIVVGDAGDGAQPGPITHVPGTSVCDGHTGCCTSGAGCGNNTTGPEPPPKAGDGAPAQAYGEFDATGYRAGSGDVGMQGNNGVHGKPGALGQNLGDLCRQGGSCGSCQNGSGQSACPGTCQGGSAPSAYGPLSGEAGRCGCGGIGGGGGPPGPGGGASVALFVTQGAAVAVTYSRLGAGDGGDGAPGGKGGNGGTGAAGIPGAAGSCATGCYQECFGSCGCTISQTALGGAAGTLGGIGGLGGDGGGGAGGPSFALVSVGGSIADQGNNSFTFGEGGTGAPGAPNGAAGPQL